MLRGPKQSNVSSHCLQSGLCVLCIQRVCSLKHLGVQFKFGGFKTLFRVTNSNSGSKHFFGLQIQIRVTNSGYDFGLNCDTFGVKLLKHFWVYAVFASVSLVGENSLPRLGCCGCTRISSGVYICKSEENYLRHGNYICKS